jgi:type 1 glutamine amidotransferase
MMQGGVTMLGRRMIALAAAMWTLLSIGPPSAANAADQLRVLLLSGANNHDWRTTTPRLKEILENSGRFSVDVLEQTHQMTAEMLAASDVIVSDFNTFTSRNQPPRDDGWSEQTKSAYIDFVRGGKGHVAVHAGSSSFYDWPEYQELVISSFKVGQTDHGLRHTFPVRIDVDDHPITRGMKAFTTLDELWHNAPVQEGATVLASAFSSEESKGSGKFEPVAMVRPFGRGRSFTLLLGHDVKAMESGGFQALLARGTEWAASGEVTILPTGRLPKAKDHAMPNTWEGLLWKAGDDAIALMAGDDRVVWQFNYGGSASKPYFHPLALPGGPTLTWQSPPDHPWHHGLWFCWKLINGVNFWEEDPQTGRSDGSTEWSRVQIMTREDFSARIGMRLDYRIGEEEPVLSEQRFVNVSPPDADGTYHLDWTMTFTALRDVLLDRTPLPEEPDGKVWGGYAGLSVRLAAGLADRQVVSGDGEVTFKDDRFRGRARAVDYTGRLEGGEVEQEVGGVAILDQPGNLNSPSPWYVIMSDPMSFFSPAVICYHPHSMKAGESMTLRYRVIVHRGRWDQARVLQEYAAFAGGNKK